MHGENKEINNQSMLYANSYIMLMVLLTSQSTAVNDPVNG